MRWEEGDWSGRAGGTGTPHYTARDLFARRSGDLVKKPAQWVRGCLAWEGSIDTSRIGIDTNSFASFASRFIMEPSLAPFPYNGRA